MAGMDTEAAAHGALSSGTSAKAPDADVQWPVVTVVIPLKDAFDGLESCLRSVLGQDYPDFEVIFATEAGDDGAVGTIRRLKRNHPAGVEHVVAGRSTQCGQKNANMLAAIRHRRIDAQVLVFCDSSHMAPADWLRELVRPLAVGHSQVSTAYHTVMPEKTTATGAGRAATVLFMHLLQLTPGLTQTWGGSTAMDLRLYLALDVDGLWRENVVDDVSVSALLARYGESVLPVKRTVLFSPLGNGAMSVGQELAAWRIWLIRQWIYLKFIWPGSWLAAGAAQYAMALAVAGGLLGAVFGETLLPGLGRAPCLLFIACMAGLGMAFRSLHPRPGPVLPWLAGFFAAPVMGALCHLANWPLRHIDWGGRRYRVDSGGTVVR